MANYFLETEAEVHICVDNFMDDLAHSFSDRDLLVIVERFLDYRDSLNFAERLGRAVNEWIEEYEDH